jgi:hypothetical protein
LKLQAAMENKMELPAEETIAQLKVDVIQAEQDCPFAQMQLKANCSVERRWCDCVSSVWHTTHEQIHWGRTKGQRWQYSEILHMS